MYSLSRGVIKVKVTLQPFIIFLIPLLLIADLDAYAQDTGTRLNFFHLSRTDGLSDNNVTSILNDNDGFLWIGTTNGLNRYNGYDFKVYKSTRNDTTTLPGNHIVDLALDHDGVLWAGIFSDGIASFNQATNTFRRYSLVQDYEDHSPNEVRGVAVDGSNTIWVATPGGLFFKLSNKESFERVHPLDSHLVVNSSRKEYNGLSVLCSDIAYVATDNYGGVWVVYPDLGLTYLSNTNNTSVHYSRIERSKEIPSKVHIHKVLPHGEHLLVVTENNGLLRVEPESNLAGFAIVNDSLNNPTDVFYHNGVLWITSFNGLFRYEEETQDLKSYIHRPADTKSLKATAVNVVYVDNQNILWVGIGSSGLSYSSIRLPFSQIIEDVNDPQMISHSRVNSMLHDSQGNLWVGYQSGAVDMLQTSSKERVHIPTQTLFGDAGIGAVFDLYQDSQGDIYMGSWLGGLQKFNKGLKRFESVAKSFDDLISRFHGVDVRAIRDDDHGNLWLAVHGKGLLRYNKRSGATRFFNSVPELSTTLSNPHIFNFFFDDDQDLWVTTAWGVNRLGAKDSVFVRYFSTDFDGSLIGNHLPAMHKDNAGRLWFGGAEGLSLYNPIDDNFTNFEFDSYGLGHITIRSIQDDAHGNLWISSSHGIVWLDLNNENPFKPTLEKVFLYDVTHGILSEDFFQRSSSRDSRGIIYFGGTSGIDFFNPNEIIQPTAAAPISIEEVKVFNTTISWGSRANLQDPVVLSHKENMLSFRYVALNFLDIHRSNYLYKLDPIDDSWHSTGRERSVTFANLAPGSYVFRVRSCYNFDDCDANEANFSFIIKPPFWQTPVFLTLVSLLFFGLVWALPLLRVASIKRKKKELETLVSRRTKELSRLNSVKDKLFSIIAHDLKNPFSSIMGFAEILDNAYDEYDDTKRKEILGYIKTTARQTYMLLENLLQWSRSQSNMIMVRYKVVNLFEHTQSTISLVMGSYSGKDVSLINNVDKELNAWADPELFKLILRNLLTNALKFTPSGGSVTIHAHTHKQGMARIDVTDTGIGIPEEYKDSLFSMDSYVNRHGTAGEEGTGIGLSLCLEFVKRMGGEIWVAETSPRGTTLSFLLPLYNKGVFASTKM